MIGCLLASMMTMAAMAPPSDVTMKSIVNAVSKLKSYTFSSKVTVTGTYQKPRVVEATGRSVAGKPIHVRSEDLELYRYNQVTVYRDEDGSWQRYAFGGPNPTKRTDPSARGLRRVIGLVGVITPHEIFKRLAEGSKNVLTEEDGDLTIVQAELTDQALDQFMKGAAAKVRGPNATPSRGVVRLWVNENLIPVRYEVSGKDAIISNGREVKRTHIQAGTLSDIDATDVSIPKAVAELIRR